MDTPWLTVVIPTINSTRFLSETLNSLVQQEQGGFQCIVVDGGSTDGTLELIDGYKSRLDIRVLIRPDLESWMDKTNFGFSQTTTQYVCMLHHDDVWLKDRVRRLSAEMQQHPNVDLFIHAVLFIDEGGTTRGKWTCPLPRLPAPTGRDLLIQRLLVQNFIAMPAPVFTRSAAQAVGGIDRNLWYTGDWDFYLKLAERSTAGYIAEPLAGFRIHSRSLTMTGSRQIEDFELQLQTVLRRHIGRIDPESRAAVRAVCQFSVEVNIALAGIFHGRRIGLASLLLTFLRLGPFGATAYVRDSRILQRVVARVRARLYRRTR